MKKNVLGMKQLILLILIFVVSFWGIHHLDVLLRFFNKIYFVFLPFILGGVLAFILNILVNKIETFLCKRVKIRKERLRILSISISLLIFIFVLVLIAFLLLPQLIDNIALLINNLPTLIENTKNYILDLLNQYPKMQSEIETFFSNSGTMTDLLSNVLNYLLSSASGFVGSLISGFITFFTAIIFAIYMLSCKEYLSEGSRKVILALFNKKQAEKVFTIGQQVNKTFTKFITGQCLEAALLGLLMFLALSLFQFPYTLIISVLTAITALIPIFGALIAMVIGAILIFTSEPLDALIFIIVFQVVQQIEGNFIYPKVVGKSVGLSPMWTLLAISVGGSLFGIVGMLVGLPLASILYALFIEFINGILDKKGLKQK